MRQIGHQLIHQLWGNLPKVENNLAEFQSKEAREDLKTILDFQVE